MNDPRHTSRVFPQPLECHSTRGLCLRCGLKGPDVSWSECIAALRDQIANLEIEMGKLRHDNRVKDD